jgi:hypothetical protein
VPSFVSRNDPVAPLATRTASAGTFTPTSCSRTRTVAFDVLLTLHVEAVTVVGVADALGVGVGVGDVVVVDDGAAPPHTARRKLAVASVTAMRAR